MPKVWKMPTGLTDTGEDIATSAVRELKEETGLDCVFDRM
jgi:ADP-ribose pyrophosphatase YjhB (NUDIX family)